MLLLSACGTSLTKKTDETANWSAEQLFHAAEVQLKQKNYSEAVGYLEKLEGRFPYGRYVQQAQLDIAYAYFRDGQNDLALAAVERFIHLHPAHPSVDYAYYLKGLISFNTKRGTLDFLLPQKDYADRNPEAMKKAYNAFHDLVERFPDSRYAVDARKRMVYLHNLLAKHEIYVARHYFDRGAYVAAINRAKYVLENYQRTPATEDALGIQIKAYMQMGMPQLAKDAERVLRLNYPKSAYLKNLPKDLATDQAPTPKAG
jgi:outer membrane protein assembly factor BamD